MNNFIVLYRIESIMCPADAPFGFQCWADDGDHAEEQCENAYPGCAVVWVWQGPEGIGMQAALQDYWKLDSDDACPACGEDGGTSCGATNCEY